MIKENNNTTHRTIRMKPTDVNKENETFLFGEFCN